MIALLKKTYTITVVIQEGNEEFWESLKGKTGCDEVVNVVDDSLKAMGFNAYVRLSKFSEEPLQDFDQ